MFSKSVSLLFCIFLIIPSSIFFISYGMPDHLVPDPNFDPTQGVDVPTWRIGDYWNYSTSFDF